MVTSMEAAFAVAVASKRAATVAERDLVALSEGMRYRAIFRLYDGRRFLAYGRDYSGAHLAAFDASGVSCPRDAAAISVVPLTKEALYSDLGPYYPEDYDEI